MCGETIIMTTPKAKSIDRNIIYNLAAVQCSIKEIAEAVGVSESFVKKRFMKIIEKGRAEGRKSQVRIGFSNMISAFDPDV